MQFNVLKKFANGFLDPFESLQLRTNLSPNLNLKKHNQNNNKLINTEFRTHQPWKIARTERLRRDSGSTRPHQDRVIRCRGCCSADNDAPAGRLRTGWSLGSSMSRLMMHSPDLRQETSDLGSNLMNRTWNDRIRTKYKYYKTWFIGEDGPLHEHPSSDVGVMPKILLQPEKGFMKFTYTKFTTSFIEDPKQLSL